MYICISFTCVSVSMRDVATSKRFGRDRYLFSLNWCSSSSSCWLVNAVLGLLHLPSKLDCAWAAGRKQHQFACTFHSASSIHSQQQFMTDLSLEWIIFRNVNVAKKTEAIFKNKTLIPALWRYKNLTSHISKLLFK